MNENDIRASDEGQQVPLTGKSPWPARGYGSNVVEPELPELEGYGHASEVSVSQLVEWARWARARLDVLSSEARDAREQVAALRAALDRRETAIKGLEEAIRLRRNRGIETLNLGQRVTILSTEPKEGYGHESYTGKVSGIFIDRGGVKYQVAYWASGRRFEELLDGSEVQPLGEDTLPHPNSTFVEGSS